MRRLFKTVEIGLLLFAVSFSKQMIAQNTTDSIDLFIKQKMVQSNIPCLQLAIVRNGKIDKLKNYGLASLEHQVVTSSGTTFSINSMTKAFVGVAIMQLQEQGKLNIKGPISTYIDDIPNEWKSIRIDQLLSNTSGLPNNIDEKEQVLGDGDENRNWEMVRKLPMEFSPGDSVTIRQDIIF
ncbi:serine hydrolase domain-containing protein [uncultured Chryseobacterium sp.]|uniref:serine hydrolase domain-containing protein n=1 Tax=uncultured Chryseobacterium sp. TaxID=259322 RepID=UPI0025CD2CDD|nr:serine hydrolase domain-containing protein [uncultured Chryseobacterium sp.]